MNIRELKFLTVAAVVALGLGLAGCGGGGSDTADAPPPAVEPEPTPYETAQMAIAAATTAEAAQAAYDAVKGDVTAAQGEMLQAAVDARIMAINMAARADEQKMALSDAAGMVDTSDEALSTQDGVDAARMAIAGLRQAIADAVDVDDTSMYETMLATAVTAVDDAQGGIDTETRRTNQMAALMDASTTLQTALSALSGQTPTQEQLDAANAALTGLNDAITAGADLTEDEKAPYVREAGNAAMPIRVAQTAFDDAEYEAMQDANRDARIAAARLFGGISAQMGAGDGTTFAETDRDAFYNEAGTAILLSIGDGEAAHSEVSATLSLDKKTSVADNEGWEGKRYHRTTPASAGTYEAVVYSNVAAPKQGKKFGAAASDDDFEYVLTNGGLTFAQLTAAASGTTPAAASRIVLTGVTRTAGTETFKLPDPNPQNEQLITVSGSFHGVAGTYSCDTGAGRDAACTAAVAAKGFTLAGTWTFMPTDANARVTEAADTAYSSYGWWLHKSADDRNWTASAFVDDKGADQAVGGVIDALDGTATYMGGAAGHYALFSRTGGTNDSGQFTARATLEADFTNNEDDDAITGTIDQFIGADGESRDWSVKLNASAIANVGTFGDDTNGTVWTMDGLAAPASGEWSGSLRELGDDGVPEAATGTFYTTHGPGNRMVGAFGANKQ